MPEVTRGGWRWASQKNKNKSSLNEEVTEEVIETLAMITFFKIIYYVNIRINIFSARIHTK